MGYNEVWEEPFNNQYINYSRDGLPNLSYISDIIDRIMAISEKAILANGGQKFLKEGEVYYTLP
jgi:hypothetical protein